MKFVDSGFEIIPQENGMDGLYRHVEKIARVSYKSEDRITDDSAKKMIDSLINNQHLACLEHGTIYLRYVYDFDGDPELPIEDYAQNPYSRVHSR
jgi:thymidylate synthase (FAD)